MKPKDIQVFKDDYSKVCGQSNLPNDYMRDSLRNYFYLDRHFSLPKASTSACESVDTLTEFIVSNWFPTSGSWVDFKLGDDYDKQDIHKARKLRDAFIDRIGTTNFYSEMAKLIKGGLVYQQALMDVEYAGSLTFKTSTCDDIKISNDSNIANKRIYVRNTYSGEDMRAMFNNLPELFYRPVEGLDVISTVPFDVITAIIPISDKFFNNPDKSKGKFLKMYFCIDGRFSEILEKSDEEAMYYNILPCSEYSLPLDTSLGMKALPHAIRIEDYEKDLSEYSSNASQPPRFVGEDAYIRGQYNFHSRGVTVVRNNEQKPGTLEAGGNLPFTMQDLERIEAKIRRIFKSDFIDRASIQHLSQVEIAGNRLSALEAICPLINDFMNRSLLAIIKRAHLLLKEYDREYKKICQDVKGDVVAKGAASVIRKQQKALGVGRFAQAAVPFLQADPSASVVLNAEAALKCLAVSHGVEEVISTQQEIDEEKEQIAKQQEQQDQMDAKQQQAETIQTANQTPNQGATNE